MGLIALTQDVVEELDKIKELLNMKEVEGAQAAVKKLRSRLQRQSGDVLYDALEPLARHLKIGLQMAIGVLSVALIVRRVDNTWNDQFGNNLPTTTDTLTVIAAGLAVAAAVELAYTLFTSGPDEAVDPLLLGLASALLLQLAKAEKLTSGEGWATFAYAASLGLLFAIRKAFVETQDPDSMSWKRFKDALRFYRPRQQSKEQADIGRMTAPCGAEHPDSSTKSQAAKTAPTEMAKVSESEPSLAAHPSDPASSSIENRRMSNSDTAVALGALYQAERGDMSTLMGHALSLISIAIAYIVGVAAVWATRPGTFSHPAVAPCLPLIVWAAMAFHAMINANVWAKNASVETLEGRLAEFAFPGDNYAPLTIGARAGRSVMDLPKVWDRQRWPFGVSTVLAYGGAGMVVVVFSGICVGASFHNHHWWLAGIATGWYLACLVVIVLTWARILKISPAAILDWNRDKTSGGG